MNVTQRPQREEVPVIRSQAKHLGSCLVPRRWDLGLYAVWAIGFAISQAVRHYGWTPPVAAQFLAWHGADLVGVPFMTCVFMTGLVLLRRLPWSRPARLRYSTRWPFVAATASLVLYLALELMLSHTGRLHPYPHPTGWFQYAAEWLAHWPGNSGDWGDVLTFIVSWIFTLPLLAKSVRARQAAGLTPAW